MRLRDSIGRWLPFGFWVLMTIVAVITLIVCISLIVARLAVVWATIGAVGCLLNIVIYGIQSIGEWQEAKNYEPLRDRLKCEKTHMTAEELKKDLESESCSLTG